MLTRDGKVIPSEKRDTNFVNRFKMDVVHNYEASRPKNGDWQIAKTSDLKVWQNYYTALSARDERISRRVRSRKRPRRCFAGVEQI